MFVCAEKQKQKSCRCATQATIRQHAHRCRPTNDVGEARAEKRKSTVSRRRVTVWVGGECMGVYGKRQQRLFRSVLFRFFVATQVLVKSVWQKSISSEQNYCTAQLKYA